MHRQSRYLSLLLTPLLLTSGCLFTSIDADDDSPSDDTSVRDTTSPIDTSNDTQPATDTSDASDIADTTDVPCSPATESGNPAPYEVCSNGIDDNCDGSKAARGDTLELDEMNITCGTVGTPCQDDSDCRSGHCVSAPVVADDGDTPDGLSVCGARMFTTSVRFHGNMRDTTSASPRSPDDACEDVAADAMNRNYAPLDAIINDAATRPFKDAAPGTRNNLPVYTPEQGYQRLDVVIPAVRPDGSGDTKILTKNPVEHFPVASNTDLDAKPNHDETGTEIDPQNDADSRVWTGWNGMSCSKNGTDTLWTASSNFKNGGGGNLDTASTTPIDVDDGWRSAFLMAGCNLKYRLYCIEQPR